MLVAANAKVACACCRRAVKIDQNQQQRLNEPAVSATVVNVGCIPGAGSPARHRRLRCGRHAGWRGRRLSGRR